MLLSTVFSVRAQANDTQSEDALSGRFSIRDNGEQVVFSRGNLCLAIDSSSWSFARNQYDIIGTLNIFGGALSTPIDLFGYSGSTYYNWGVSPVNANSLFGGDFIDWGENAIGSSPAGYWRTMTYYEWNYLLNQRTNAETLKGVAEVSGQRGLVLLPDTATTPVQATYTAIEWTLAEQRGAVFLPFAGRRIRANRVDSIGSHGYYWTSTTNTDSYAYIAHVSQGSTVLEQSDRMHGHSVRLIHSVGIHRDSVYNISVYQNCTFTPAVDTKASALAFSVGVDNCAAQYSNMFAFRDIIILQAVADDCGEFVAWSDGVTDNPRRIQLVGSTTLRAIFRTTKHEVRFLNSDGTTVATDSVICGGTPTLPAVNPSREATAQYSYTFTGWAPEITAVTADQTYTAVYDSTLNKYRVDFVDYDGTPLAFDSLDYGQMPAYNGTEPTRPATSAFEYTFAAWTPAFSAVTGDQVYTARYDSISLLFIVRFVDYNDSLLTETYLDYGQMPSAPAITPSREATAQYTYTFAGWTPAFYAVTDDQTYTATYDSIVNRYRVAFADYDGTILSFDTLNYGQMPAYTGTEPAREATAEYTYTFAGWTPELGAATSEMTYTAVYDSVVNRYRIDFVDYDGTPLTSDTFAYGMRPNYNLPTLPTREATAEYTYTFAGWTPGMTPVSGDQTYTATYDSVTNRYAVSYYDYDGTLLRTDSLDYGMTPAFTDDEPARLATAEFTYTFAGWIPQLTAVMSDQNYTAVYDSVVNRYEIIFQDYDATVLQTDTLDYGQLPAFRGAKPARTATEHFTYTFVGWTPAVTTVTAHAVYTAAYDSVGTRYAISYFDFDGSLLATDSLEYGMMPQYQGDEPARTATAEYTYNFIGWTPALESVTTDRNYTAVYDSVINRYAVSYLDYDGSLIRTDSVEYGSMPQYQGDEPARTATAEYTYNFTGWTPAMEAVTGDAVYTATYDSVLNKYLIVFMDYDDAELQTDTMYYGQMPAFHNIMPPRQGTAEYSYVFVDWSPALTTVTGNAVYTALYDSVINRYAVRYMDYDNTLLRTDSLEYGTMPQYEGDEPTRTATAEFTYTFTGWTPAFETVMADQNYTATYDSTINRYEVRFVDYDGTLLQTDSLDYGMLPAFTGNEPAREATAEYTYSFTGWSPAVTTVAGDAVYTAAYDSVLIKYEIVFLNYDGTPLYTDSVAYNRMPVYGGATQPARVATAEYTYTFAGWDPALTAVIGDQTYTATYDSTLNRYRVSYYDYNGSLIQADSLYYGDSPAYAGTTPSRSATAQYTYLFMGWTPAYETVTADQNYTAVYDSVLNRYEVRFVNYDNSLLQSDSLDYGLMPAYNGPTPTRPSNVSYSYTFRRWTPNVTTVTGDATYTAAYDSTAMLYTIRFFNYDSTLLYTTQVTYGTLPVYRGNTPTRAATAEFSYEFSGWFPAICEVTGDADYIATYAGVRVSYKVEFRDYDGTLLETDSVPYGVTPAYTGSIPTREANAQYTYTFTGWDPALTATTSDAVYTAAYDSIVNRYTVTFLNYDGTVLQSTAVEYGTMPLYEASEPQKPRTDEFSYIFTGWMPELVTVTEAANYTAVFDSVVNTYTVTLLGDNATFIGAGTYEYGTTVTIEALPDDGYHFVEWSDGNWRNRREITVKANVTLTALIEIDCIGLNSVPVEKIYDWLLLVNVSGLEQMGYTVTDENVTWFRAIGEIDDPEHRDDDELVGRGFYLKVGEGFVGNGRFYAVVDVSDNISANDNLCTGLIRSDVVTIGFTGLDDLTADSWKPYLYPAAVRPGNIVTIQGLLPAHETHIRLYDLAGHVLAEDVAPRGETQYLLTAPGVSGSYLVELTTDNQQIVLRYIVMQP